MSSALEVILPVAVVATMVTVSPSGRAQAAAEPAAAIKPRLLLLPSGQGNGKDGVYVRELCNLARGEEVGSLYSGVLISGTFGGDIIEVQRLLENLRTYIPVAPEEQPLDGKGRKGPSEETPQDKERRTRKEAVEKAIRELSDVWGRDAPPASIYPHFCGAQRGSDLSISGTQGRQSPPPFVAVFTSWIDLGQHGVGISYAQIPSDINTDPTFGFVSLTGTSLKEAVRRLSRELLPIPKHEDALKLVVDVDGIEPGKTCPPETPGEYCVLQSASGRIRARGGRTPFLDPSDVSVSSALEWEIESAEAPSHSPVALKELGESKASDRLAEFHFRRSGRYTLRVEATAPGPAGQRLRVKKSVSIVVKPQGLLLFEAQARTSEIVLTPVSIIPFWPFWSLQPPQDAIADVLASATILPASAVESIPRDLLKELETVPEFSESAELAVNEDSLAEFFTITPVLAGGRVFSREGDWCRRIGADLEAEKPLGKRQRLELRSAWSERCESTLTRLVATQLKAAATPDEERLFARAHPDNPLGFSALPSVPETGIQTSDLNTRQIPPLASREGWDGINTRERFELAVVDHNGSATRQAEVEVKARSSVVLFERFGLGVSWKGSEKQVVTQIGVGVPLLFEAVRAELLAVRPLTGEASNEALFAFGVTLNPACPIVNRVPTAYEAGFWCRTFSVSPRLGWTTAGDFYLGGVAEYQFADLGLFHVTAWASGRTVWHEGPEKNTNFIDLGLGLEL